MKKFLENANAVTKSIEILQEKIKEDYLGEMASATPWEALYLWLNAPAVVQGHSDWIIEETPIVIKLGLREYPNRYDTVHVGDPVYDWLTTNVMSDDCAEMYAEAEGNMKRQIALLHGLCIENPELESAFVEIADLPHTFKMDW